jgi:amino-acid N-acetyltransferase
MKINIRPATAQDVKQMHALINHYAKEREMLPRSLNSIYENLQEYLVAMDGKKLAGCCALHVSWEDLAEVKALAVDQNTRGKGVGTKMVLACHKNALKLGIHKVFCLTYRPGFFEKLGYKQISRDELPHKVWGECINCPHFPDCGEVPLIVDLSAKTKKR